MQDTAGEARTSSSVIYSNGPPHMAKQKPDDQLEHTYSSYVRIRDVALKTCQRRWTIGRSGERGSGISVLAAHDDDDDDIMNSFFDWKKNQGNIFYHLTEGFQRLVIWIKTNSHHWTLTSTITSGPCWPNSDGNEVVLGNSPNSRTGISPLEHLVSYSGHSLTEGFLNLCRDCQRILQPHPIELISHFVYSVFFWRSIYLLWHETFLFSFIKSTYLKCRSYVES